jgi:hypothetical protein
VETLVADHPVRTTSADIGKRMLNKTPIPILIAAALAAGCSAGNVDQSDLGIVLPIRVGVYVNESQTCEDPANAGILSFDGEGLSGAHTYNCQMKIQSHQLNLFAYSQRCVETGAGDGSGSTELGLMRIESDKRFSLHQKSGDIAFNYCEPSTLPPGIPVPIGK